MVQPVFEMIKWLNLINQVNLHLKLISVIIRLTELFVGRLIAVVPINHRHSNICKQTYKLRNS